MRTGETPFRRMAFPGGWPGSRQQGQPQTFPTAFSRCPKTGPPVSRLKQAFRVTSHAVRRNVIATARTASMAFPSVRDGGTPQKNAKPRQIAAAHSRCAKSQNSSEPLGVN
jgi:hypothetical protein